MEDRKSWLDLALRCVLKAREAVSRESEGVLTVRVGASGDETLKVDEVAEEAIVDEVRRSLSEATVISEELGVLELGGGGPPYVFIDPLDGSLNAKRGYPCYSSMVALASGPRLGDVEAMAVANLLTGDLYWAVKGGGAFRNGARVEASRCQRLEEALVSIDFSKRGRPVGYAKRIAAVIEAARYVRFLGSNSLEVCLVACGACDAFIDLRGDLRLLDVSGPLLMVREAGGAVYVEPGGLDAEVDVKRKAKLIAAATPSLVEEVLRLIEA